MEKIRFNLENGITKPLYELSGGMMNKSQVVEIDGRKYVWYVPTEQANQMVDRQLEKENQQIIYELGITSKNLAFYDDGMKINEFIPGDSLNHIDNFDVKKVAIMLKKLHNSKKLSRKDYLPFSKVLGYEKEAQGLGLSFDDDYYKLIKICLENREFLESQKLALCHNDFQRSNIIRTPNDEYFVIDFEFVMNNDPLFDVAAFGNNDVNEGYSLLQEYCNHNVKEEEKERFCYWRMLLSLQWYLVALIKDAHGEGAVHGFDFKQVAAHFLDNAKDAYDLLNK